MMAVTLLLSSLVRAAPVPDCNDDVAMRAGVLANAFDEARRALTAASPFGAPIAPARGWLLSVAGPGVGLGLSGAPTCTSPSGPVHQTKRPPLTDGRTATYRGESVLEVRNPTEYTEQMTEWRAIVVHEYFHLDHEARAGVEAATGYRQEALERHYARDPAFEARVDALVGQTTSAASLACDLGPLAASYAAHRETLSARDRQDEDRWLVTEGLAKYVETRWMMQYEALDDNGRRMACTNLSNPYGYALGCALADTLAHCGPADWAEVVIRDGFTAALAAPRAARL
ncbi:MAG: hypothetical protein FJ090_06505 [Deltaproteobacteria bacterium]|nr:hypothetical protein [Deltaproteobacteria bacterium]MBM4390756.1 hypothetical protein [Deltaproteobacteria bacterium]